MIKGQKISFSKCEIFKKLTSSNDKLPRDSVVGSVFQLVLGGAAGVGVGGGGRRHGARKKPDPGDRLVWILVCLLFFFKSEK